MKKKTIEPLPAAAAGSGPFILLEPREGLNFSVFPTKKKSGVLSAPLKTDASALAIRVHEYGHLLLKNLGIIRGIDTALSKSGVHNSWFQSGLDVILNSFLLNRGCDEIRHLPLEFKVDELISHLKCAAAQVFLRSTHLETENALKAKMGKMLSKKELALLNKAMAMLVQWGQTEKIPKRRFFNLLIRLQKQFGVPHADKSENKIFALGQNEDSKLEDALENTIEAIDDENGMAVEKRDELIQNIASAVHPNDLKHNFLTKKLIECLPGHGTKLFIKSSNKWGKMNIKTPQFTRSQIVPKESRRLRPGFIGAFRYPHRALIPLSDGAAFAYMQKAKGGAILLDCSGSMGLTFKNIETLLEHAPMATVACYASDGDCTAGYLLIAAKKGRVVRQNDLENWYDKIGSGNVIDGPALQWLSKQEHPRIWISDADVTGLDDCDSANLTLEAGILARKGEIKRFDNISKCLKHFKMLK